MLFKKVLILGIATAVVSYVRAQDAVAPKDSTVVKLTGETFGSFIDKNPLVLVEFFAPWCGHCKHLGPEYVSAASQLVEKNIPLVQVDCDQEKQLCMNYSIKGYPSLKVFRDGKTNEGLVYNGLRTASEIVKYMKKQAQPIVTVVEGPSASKDFKNLLGNLESPLVVDGGVSGLNATFWELAELYRKEFSFVQYANGNSKLCIHLPGESEPIIYNGGKQDLEHLSEWVKVESFPYFGEVDASTFAKYMDSDIPLAYFFYTTEEERNEYSDFFKGLGKKYRGELNFAGLDSRKFGRLASALNMKDQFPLVSIYNFTSSLKYGLPQLSDEEFEAAGGKVVIDRDEVTKFVEDFLKHKLQPNIKSEEIPETQESSVYKLVSKSHDDIVNDPKKDVLVKYYAPWCGHCKRLAPTFEQLADIYASDDEAREKILIADIDATENDVNGINIEGFPTIYLYPAGKDSKPVLHESSRTLESFIEFVQKHGKTQVDGLAIKQRFDAQSGEGKVDDKKPGEADPEYGDWENDEL